MSIQFQNLPREQAEFHARRAEFFGQVCNLGFGKERANYCITIAKRLRAIYAESTRIAEQEHEELLKLRNVLDQMPAEPNPFTGEVVKWECIVGGIEEGDDTVLYIVPPGYNPIAVPMPEETDQEKEIREWIKRGETAQEWARQQWEHYHRQQTPRDLDPVQVEHAMKDLARQLGWSTELIGGATFARWVRLTVEMERSRRQGDYERADAIKAEGSRICDELKAMHRQQHGPQQERMIVWQGRELKIKADEPKSEDEIARAMKAIPKEYLYMDEETGYRAIQERNERQKRRGRYNKW